MSKQEETYNAEEMPINNDELNETEHTGETETGYTSKGKIKSIKVTSRTATKIGDNYYTFEYSEERSYDEDAQETMNPQLEREGMWNLAHGQVDAQIEEIIEAIGQQ